jgi:hypothetical protein
MLIVAMETEKQGEEKSNERYKMIDVLDELRAMKDRQGQSKIDLLASMKSIQKKD